MSHAALQLQYWRDGLAFCGSKEDREVCDEQLRFWAALIIQSGIY